MTKQEFDNERLYLRTMSHFKTLLDKGVITTEEYTKIQEMFEKKYFPVLGSLFLKK